jgi:hypothetical protein
MPGKSLTEKEQRILFGNTRTATIYHHPLSDPQLESDIGEDVGYVAPDAVKKATLRYMTAVRLPYLTTSNKVSDYGKLCIYCNLHMSFTEHEWKREQATRRRNGHDSSASLRRRNLVNGAREMACTEYTNSKEALEDQRELSMKMVEDNGTWTEMSFQEHKLTHENEKLSPREREFRAMMKIPEELA